MREKDKFVVIPPPYGLYWEDISDHISSLFGDDSEIWFGTNEESRINLFYTCPNDKTPYYVLWSSGLSDTQNAINSSRREFVLYMRDTPDVCDKMNEIHTIMNALTMLYQTKQKEVPFCPGAAIKISKENWLLITETVLPGGIVPIMCQDNRLIEFYQLIVVTSKDRKRIVNRNSGIYKKQLEMYQVMNPSCLFAKAMDFQLDELDE